MTLTEFLRDLCLTCTPKGLFTVCKMGTIVGICLGDVYKEDEL
jgi:hypothetical protein